MLQFQVASGGFLDVDSIIYGPTSNVIHSVERESEGKFTFTAEKKGVYKFCFSNMMSTLTPKTVSFQIVVGDLLDPNLAKIGTFLLYETAIWICCFLTRRFLLLKQNTWILLKDLLWDCQKVLRKFKTNKRTCVWENALIVIVRCFVFNKVISSLLLLTQIFCIIFSSHLPLLPISIMRIVI